MPTATLPFDSLRPRLPSPLLEIDDERWGRHGVRLLLKRDDLIHPDLPGNKWRKLRPNLQAAADAGHDTLLTFGGAYSNHVRAVAAAGRHFGFATVGVIRGEEHLPLNPSLAAAAADGMRLTYLDRTTYRHKGSPEVVDGLRARFGRFFLIPEGGSNALAARGCAALGEELRDVADAAAVACGTGGTLAGLAAGLGPGRRAVGFSVLRGGAFLADEVGRLQREAFGARTGDWELEDRFHFGGYARSTPELEAFAADFEDRHGVALERVYVAKMLGGLLSLTEEGRFPRGTTLAAVVTG